MPSPLPVDARIHAVGEGGFTFAPNSIPIGTSGMGPCYFFGVCNDKMSGASHIESSNDGRGCWDDSDSSERDFQQTILAKNAEFFCHYLTDSYAVYGGSKTFRYYVWGSHHGRDTETTIPMFLKAMEEAAQKVGFIFERVGMDLFGKRPSHG